ncbi:MFS transporter, DHA1 family, bicyclomycin/chloramphenicol resistance protein [Lutimaribacter pacificus]|uniref:Bcr/CflA family efflux transporter n=1 Tax=Lutimaribacter pacificus TaxID=391948 RepID=A0A1H0J959_9RHOB|nr:multidrug effflux MFS transporter [Lutimaribacter pacificus]SDO40142.1 MFS transporter, DHA1 family, bicyclomycin/chloramphenicol resistance protein [Lutimaribacter pacificus]SHK12642.1 MFS transporter, DHA1 family, bicyclomycin/chloramphenicol resistance protein [Lutimaribacter pacificus]
MSDTHDVRYLDRTTPPHISTLILLAGISALSMNVFLPSLPGMTAYFDTEYRLMQLSVAIYLAMNAALQVLVGPISDKFGRRPVILGGLALYVLATVGCLVAPNVTVFLICRMLQAVIAVAMVLSRAVVRDMFAQDRAASMIGYVTMGMAVVPMISPAIGGFLEELFGWHANFWLLLLAGLLVFWLAWRDLGETATETDNTLWDQFREYPELLKSPRFWGYCLAAAFGSGAFFAYLGGAPFVASNVFHLNPGKMGVYFAAPSLGYFVGNWITGAYAARAGVNRMVLWGTIVATVGMAMSLLSSYTGHSSPLSFFGFMTLVGVGNGMVISNATAGMLSVRPHLAGTASGLGGAIMIGGGAALSALAGALLVPGAGEFPLIWIMFFTSLFAVFAIVGVIWRERQLGL